MEKKFPFFKILTLLVWLVLGMGQAFAANCAADYVAPENLVWDGTSIQEPCQDPVDKYYVIDNAAKLAWYGANYSKGNAKLTADIDLGGHLWIPIAAGKGDVSYGKTFNGQNHIIKNLYINGNELSSINATYPQNLGFVGVLGGGKVLNLILENVDIQASTNAGTIISNQDNQISVGAVVGWMSDKGNSVVDNCMTSGTIKTTGNSQGVGGIVGNAKKGTISNCMSLVEIQTSGSKAYIGGIIGITKTDVTVSSCIYAGPGLTNTGTDGAVGGIAGNVWSGKISTENDFYEGTNYYQGEKVGGVGKSCTGCDVTDQTVQVNNINSDVVICALNGKNADSTCKTEPWSFGETGPSLNGYGIDGYKIVFNANGGAFANGKANKDKFLNSGMAITADEVGTPSRNNYKFAGWAMTRDATAPAADLGTVSKTDTIFAVWAPVYIVTFNVAPGVFPETNESEKTKQVASGEVITVEGLGTLPTSRCKVYVSGSDDECETFSYFTGWALTEGALEKDSVSLDTVTASDGLVLHAVWTDVETYTVTYNANHHGTTTVDYVRVGAGDTVTVPTDPIADSGYEFAGWFTDADGVNPYQFAAQIHESIVLYAKWTLKRFDISYVMNNEDAVNGDNPISYTIDTAFVLNAPADVEGYVFEGWFYDAELTSPATQIIKGTTGTKTFYAKFSAQTYKITYLPGNAPYGAASDQVKTHGTPIELRSSGYFTFPGFDQAGWSTDPNGETEYELGATYAIDAPLTLYPTKGGKATYTITYECEGCDLDNTTYTSDDQFDLIGDPNPKEGYHFAWYIDQAYTTPISRIKKGSYGNLNLHGRWNLIYTVTYVCEGCDVSNDVTFPKTYDVDSKFGLPFPTAPDGYIFAGWYKESTFKNKVDNVQVGTTGNLTFYGKLNKIYNIEYVLNGSTESRNKDNYTVDDKTFTLNAPAPVDGFTFGGWYTNAEFEGDAVTQVPKGSTGDKIFYAKWYPYVVQYGAVTITEHEDGTKTAVIDGEYTGSDAIDIPTPIDVDNIVINREFTANTPGTIVLPFTLPSGTNLNGAKFYYLKEVVQHPTKYAWKATMKWIGDGVLPSANTPYSVICTGSSLEFGLNGDKARFETNELEGVPALNTNDWNFVGTYVYKTWESEDEKKDLADGLVYGIAGQNDDGVPKGTFAKATSANKVYPMRAYMRKSSVDVKLKRVTQPQTVRARGASYGLNNIGSEIIEVEFVDDEKTTAIGRMNTVTGEIKIDRWFDLKGRHVKNVNRAAKGAYYGKKVFHE